VCTVIGRKGLLCMLNAQLSKRTLTAQGLLPERAHDTPIALTGGTGAYDGARHRHRDRRQLEYERIHTDLLP
jgi:hypothetical protein